MEARTGAMAARCTNNNHYLRANGNNGLAVAQYVRGGTMSRKAKGWGGWGGGPVRSHTGRPIAAVARSLALGGTVTCG